MYKLRPYQEEAVRAAMDGFTKGKPFIIQAATGAGKSLIIAEICHRLSGSVLILQPSKELLEQNYDKLISYGFTDIGIYSASKNSMVIARFTYATIGSIYRVPHLFSHFDHVIIDECHVVDPKKMGSMYTSFLKAIGCTRVCGLTATPYRVCQKFFQDERQQLFYTAFLKVLPRIGYPSFWGGGIRYKIETQELIDQGYLSPIEYDIKAADLSGLEVNSTGQNYTDESLECYWNDAKLRGLADSIREIDRRCHRNLIFCSSIRQGRRAVEMLNGGGLSVAMVTGETPAKERETIVSDFRLGKIRHLVNVSCFTTGFDVPELDSIVLARPTMSLGLYYQMVGRGVRLDPARPSKRLLVTDLAGCVERLGKVESIRVTKEDGGFKDQVESDAGIMTDVPLFTFQVTKDEKRARFTSAY